MLLVFKLVFKLVWSIVILSLEEGAMTARGQVNYGLLLLVVSNIVVC